MNVAAAPSTMDPSGCPPNGRYEYLLQQVVQLNTDLHKTVALSQSLKSERDSLQELTQRLKQDVMRCEERCEKMQEVLMTETEYKVQSDRKHEALMHKWKQQLEIKAREFEVLQKNLAPPKDLDQLRLAIQNEVELPHRQRVGTTTLFTAAELVTSWTQADATKFATQMTDVLGKLTNVDLELKATARQKLREATDDAMRLREQVKQKDLL
ncbi:hypothetical protein DYB25_010651, partial [Aphanomyces astaci]